MKNIDNKKNKSKHNKNKSNSNKNKSKRNKNKSNSNKNIFIAIIIFVAIIIIIFAMFNHNWNKKSEFELDEIYKVYPEDVQKLYTNFVQVSCSGDLHFNFSDKEQLKLEDIDKKDLLSYMFSYMDKNSLLSDNIDVSVINDTEKLLFYGKLELSDYIKNYQYGEYVYDLNNGKIERKKQKCISDVTYISSLFGYTADTKVLSIDMNITYLKDGILYDIKNNELGKYDGKTSTFSELTEKIPYYRINYVKNNDKYKLDSINIMNRD